MHYAVFVAQFGGRRRSGLRFGEKRVYAALRVRVQHEKLAGVGACVAKQFEAIGLRAGKCLLVTKNDSGGIILELARADKSPARASFVCAGNGVLLRVSVKGRGRVLHDDVVVSPIL